MKTAVSLNTKELQKSTTIFNWSPYYKNRQIEPEDALTSLKNKIVRTNANTEGAGFVGKGVYFSTDPVATQAFGELSEANSNWYLYQVELSKETKFFDIRNEITITDELLSLFKKLGCTITFKNFQLIFMEPESSPCLRMLRATLKEQNIALVNYNYFSVSKTFGITEDPGAFVVISNDIPQDTKAKLLRSSFVINDPDNFDKSFIQAFTKKANNLKPNDGNGLYIEAWPTAPTVTDTELEKWYNNKLHLFDSHTDNVYSKGLSSLLQSVLP